MVASGLELSIRNYNRSIVFGTSNAEGFLRLRGAMGLGVAPTSVSAKDRAAGGTRIRSAKRVGRVVDIPIAAQAQSAAELRAMLNDLIYMCSPAPDRTKPRLYVRYETGEQLYVEVVYNGGIDPQYGVDTNRETYVKTALSLRTEDPFWTSTQALNFAMVTPNAGRGLIKDNTSLTELQVSSSQTIGQITINNPGNVASPIFWTLRGPGNNFSAELLQTGESFMYNAPITNSNPIFISDKGRVVDSEGERMYTNIAPAPRFFKAPPGVSTVYVQMDGADATSRISFFFNPRYEMVF